MWKHFSMKLFITKKTETGTIKALINNNGNSSTNTKSIANTLNDCFSNVGKTLYENLTLSNFEPPLATNSHTNVIRSIFLWKEPMRKKLFAKLIA